MTKDPYTAKAHDIGIVCGPTNAKPLGGDQEYFVARCDDANGADAGVRIRVKQGGFAGMTWAVISENVNDLPAIPCSLKP